MQGILVDVINNFGYAGIALLIFLESIFPPLPSEIILLFGGFATTYTSMNPWLVILSATAGSLAGACVLYYIGWLLNKEKLKRLLSGKWGKTLHLRPAHIDMADAWFNKYGNKAVLFCRCVPIVRSLISIPAGMAKMPKVLFALLTALGSLVWNTVIVWLGKLSGDAWEETLQYLDWYSYAAVLGMALIVAVWGWIYFKKKKKRKANEIKQHEHTVKPKE